MRLSTTFSSKAGSKRSAANLSSLKRKLTQAERTALSDRRMFEAACELISTQGVTNTTLREIGELAGYSRGLASNRFGSKEALLRDLLNFVSQQWSNEIHSFVADKTGLDAFNAAMRAAEDFIATQPAHLKALYILWYDALGGSKVVRVPLASLLDAQRRPVEKWIAEAIVDGSVRPDAVPAQVAIQYSSFVFGTVYQWLINPSRIDIPRAFSEYKALLLAAIALDQGPRK
ncbi:MAG TPA: TetR/AcrR family transcriptional regulator [Rhizomicrobium sp.]|nr:TetR/AcrR family transcriptional regulator [Rhizomicrobium sp.]